MVTNIINRIDFIIDYLSNKNLYTYKLGIARSILAASTFLTLIFNDSQMMITDNGMRAAHRFDGSIYIFQKLNLFILFNAENILYAKSLALIILMVAIIGWRPRYTCILHAWVCLSFNYSSSQIEGGDQIASNLCIILIPILLMDKRKWHWTKLDVKNGLPSLERNLVANYFHVIAKLQISLIYFHAATAKIPMKEWGNGTAVYYWFNDPTFGISDWLHLLLDPILANAYGVTLLTWGTIVLEMLLFMAILMNNRAKYFFLILGILFHFFILLAHGLVSFFITMTASLLMYLWIDNPYGKIKILENEDSS